MRMSDMSGYQMVGWRGILMGSVMLLGWLVFSKAKQADLGALFSGTGLAVICCQYVNATLFGIGIATAPASIVLFGVATVPVFAAIFAYLIIKEPTRCATWLTIAAVMTGIAIAVFSDKTGISEMNRASALGALAGLGVAMALALNFVILRARPSLPILLLIGSGAILSGSTGVIVTGPAQMGNGTVWAIVLTGAVILPVSFFSLSVASRYTHASNVSLIMLIETVLGPVWVWLGIGEAPTPGMILGGMIVVVSLAIYIWQARHQS